MKSATYIKLDSKVKNQAQQIAKQFGLSLSALINAQLMQVVRRRRVEFQLDFLDEQMTPALEKKLAAIDKDVRAGKNLVGPFNNSGGLDAFFENL